MKTIIFIKLMLLTLLVAEQRAFSQIPGERTNPKNWGTFSPSSTYQDIDYFSRYKNYWTSRDNSAFTTQNDVTYIIHFNNPVSVTISTNNTHTNTDTYLHLVRLNSNGSSTYLTGNDDVYPGALRSTIQANICPGDYGIIVEGPSITNGWYELTLTGFSASPTITAGTIGIEASNNLCPNEIIPPINSIQDATSTFLGGITYQWLIHTDADEAGSFGIYPAAGNGPSATNLGSFGGYSVSFMREARVECGSWVQSNVITFNTASPTANGGTIGIYGPATTMTIPTPQEKALILTSQTDGSGSPAFTVSWEKNDGAGWSTIEGNGQTLTISDTLTTITKFRRKITSSCTGISAYSNEVTVKVVEPDGVLTGIVRNKNGQNGIPGITITVTRTTAVPGGVTNKTYTTTTGNDGTFTIVGIYYGDPSVSTSQANFTTTPSKADHVFDPLSIDRTMSKLVPRPQNMEFRDLTGYTISGTILQKCRTCDDTTIEFPLPGVAIWGNLNPGETQPEKIVLLSSKTTVQGTYVVQKDLSGAYIIEPRYENHQFAPKNREVNIDGSAVIISNVDFEDTTTHVISGYVKIDTTGGCTDTYIGQANITFTQQIIDTDGKTTIPGPFVKNVKTNAGSGYYSVRLPAAKYKVSVNSFESIPSGKGLNAAEMLVFLNNYPDSIRVRDITRKDTTLNLYFHEKPQIKVVDLAGPCSTSSIVPGNNLSKSPIFIQSQPRTFTVEVFEGSPAKGCPAKSDTLRLVTNVQGDDENENIDSVIVKGKATFTLTGGIPNIAPPYTKTFALYFKDNWGRTASFVDLKPVVTGVKVNPGSFTTVSPEIPLLILRDPPGDGSYSFWEQGNSIEKATRMYIGGATSTEQWRKVKLGTKFEAGLGVTTESEFWGKISGKLSTSAKTVNAEENIVTTTFDQQYKTSQDKYIVGEAGDVFIGAALNLLYTTSYEVIYSPDTCSFYKQKKLFIANDGFATTYIYTQTYIEDDLIPTLKTFRDYYANLPGSQNDSLRRRYQNQVNVWEQTIERNKELKRNAAFVENISFDGRVGEIQSSVTKSTSKVTSTEFGLDIDATIAGELGFEVGGSGASAGFEVNFKVESGGSTTNTELKSTTTGYVLDDTDYKDKLSVDIKHDPVYNTPVFEIKAGATSCPHEEGTQWRNAANLTIDNPYKEVAAGGMAIFDLKLTNVSESMENGIVYFLRPVASSYTGAKITINGNPFITNAAYTLDYLTTQPIQIGVEQFDHTKFSFTDLKVEVIDNCDDNGGVTQYPDVSKIASFSAFFTGGCTNITMALPEEGYVLNQAANNLLKFHMKDYTYANLDNVTVEYAPFSSSSWKAGPTLTKTQIQDSPYGTVFNLNTQYIPDGVYKFRLAVKCGANTNYSKLVNVTLDRKSPEPFGIPNPSDDIYNLGDEISISFNENMNCPNLTAANFSLTRLSNNTAVPAILSCFGNKLVITPSVDLNQWKGESLQATVKTLFDEHGNSATKPAYAWKFIIGAPIVDPAKQYLASITYASPTLTQMPEDAAGTLDVRFSFNKAPVADNLLIYFSVLGTATYGEDYTVSGAHTYDGQEGSIYIPKGGTTTTLKIDPKGDTKFEPNETIILSILSGGDYNIGTSNKVTLTILNDDNDCENGGKVYTLSNNNAGVNAISPGTYQKLLLESNGTVESPTTVIFKGERSVTLLPGFKVKQGSVFMAMQEDCPNQTNSPVINPPVQTVDDTQSVLVYTVDGGDDTSKQTNESVIDKNYQVNEITTDGKATIPFFSPTDQLFEIKLYDEYAAVIADYTKDVIYKKGTNSINIDTADLKPGTYFVIFRGKTTGQKTLHRVIIR